MATTTWKHYFEFTPIERNRTNGLCRLCKRNYKDKTGIYSNFLKHLKRSHPIEYGRSSKNTDGNWSDSTDSNEKQMDESADMKNNEKQNRIILSLAKNLIVRCNLSLSFVEKPGFRDFLRDCNMRYKPISSRRMKNEIIPSLSDTLIKRIRDQLNNVDYVTLTIDIWSDRRCRSYLGITCHFIDEKMMAHAYLIEFLRFKCSHTSDNIYQLTESVLDRFNLKDKVYRIVTDNAPNMINAYKSSFTTDESTTHRIADEDLVDEGSASLFHESTDESKSDNLQITSIIMDSQKTERKSYPIRLACFAHSLQLCIRDSLKNIPEISKVLEKCQTIVKYTDHSTKIADLLDDLHKHVRKTNATRWNSEYLLMKSIQSIGTNDLDSILKLVDNPLTFLKSDFAILDELIHILEPFHEVSIQCQSEIIVNVSMVVPAIVHFISHLRDLKPRLTHCMKLVQQLETSIENRFSGIVHRLNQTNVDENEPFNDPLYFIATVLDPSFRFYWIHDLNLPMHMENRLKQDIIQFIVNEMSNELLTNKVSTESIVENSSNFSSALSTFKTKKLFSYSHYEERRHLSKHIDAANELDNYLNDPLRFKFTDYWSKSRFTLLNKVVKRIFSVQASSAPIERVFSQAGLILTSRRLNMSERLFKDLVFLKVNQTLL